MDSFTTEPMNLKLGDGLVCLMRSKSSIGWSNWSPISSSIILKSCERNVPVEEPIVIEASGPDHRLKKEIW